MSGARKGARGEVRRRGGIAQSPGGSDVKVSSFKEAFDHVVGERGRRGTKGFHEGLIRKKCPSHGHQLPGQSPIDPLRCRQEGAIWRWGVWSWREPRLDRGWGTTLNSPECEEHKGRCEMLQPPGPSGEGKSPNDSEAGRTLSVCSHVLDHNKGR